MAENEINVVVPKQLGMRHDTVGVTPAGMTNIGVQAMHWWQIVLIRAAKTYLTTMLGLLPAIGAGAGEHVGLSAAHGMIWAAAELAVYPTLVVLLGSATMLLGQLDEKMPTAWHA